MSSSQNLSSVPSPGIRRLNKVGGNGLDVDLKSDDGSIIITPDAANRTIDLSAASGSDTVLRDIPCNEDVYLGAWVRIDVLGVAQNAISDGFDNSHVIGLCEYKTNSTTCDIRCVGLSSLVFVDLNPTKDYYLSDTTSGTMQTAIPTAQGHVMVKVGQPLSPTKFVVNIQQRVRRN